MEHSLSQTQLLLANLQNRVWGVGGSTGPILKLMGKKKERPLAPYIYSYWECTSRLRCSICKNQKVLIVRFPTLETCPTPICIICRLPFRKPTQEQPFSNYSPIRMVHQHVPKQNQTRHLNQLNARCSTGLTTNGFEKKKHCLGTDANRLSKTSPFRKVLRNTSVSLGRSKTSLFV